MKDCTSKTCYVLEAKNCCQCHIKLVGWYKEAIKKVITHGLSNENCADVSNYRSILAEVGFEPTDMTTITKEAKDAFHNSGISRQPCEAKVGRPEH